MTIMKTEQLEDLILAIPFVDGIHTTEKYIIIEFNVVTADVDGIRVSKDQGKNSALKQALKKLQTIQQGESS